MNNLSTNLLLVPQERKQQRVLSKWDLLVDTGEKLFPQERRTFRQVDAPAPEYVDDVAEARPSRTSAVRYW